MEHLSSHAHTKTPTLITQKHSADLALLLTVITLSLAGLLMVYDASQFEAFQSFKDSYYYIKQQAGSFVIGILFLGFFAWFDYHKLQKFAFPAFAVSLCLLVSVFVPGLGVSAYGAHRWLKIAGFTLQPAEIIKLASIIFFAHLFRDRTKTMPFILILSFIIVIVGFLQKDLGSSVIFAGIAMSVYFVAKAPLHHFLALFASAVLAGIGAIIVAPYRIKRVMAFLDPFGDTQGFTYHISQILIGLGSGGFFGLGIGQSRQKFAYIPEVTTDSIFSIIGEEFGFLGGLIIISLFGFLMIRGFRIAERAPDTFGRLMASGITIWLGLQAIVNLASMVALIPLTGVPLPFISFGGSALLANLVAVGILLNISRQINLDI